MTPLGARSCCKTQALLTIQHQQILENQQRQLHEMQEQIAHLRRLLDATKKMDSDTHREMFASSQVSESESLPPLEDPSEQDLAEVEEQRRSLDAVAASAVQFANSGDTGRVDDAADEDQGDLSDGGDDENARETEEVASDAESSLHLSSISSGSSMRSDISSLSSSLVGKRMKERFRKSQSGTRSLEEPAASSSGVTCDDATFQVSAQEAEDASRLQTVQGISKDALTSDSGRRGQRMRLSEEEKPEDSEDDDDNDDDVDDGEEARFSRTPLEKLLTPDTYLRQRGAFVDHHSGCFTAPTLDMHSFCVPRIKFPAATSATGGGYLSDSDDEEFRLIEQKYKRLLRS